MALPPAVDLAIGKVHGGMATVEEKARAFLLHVTARPPQWYAPHRGELGAEADPAQEAGAA